MAKLLHRGNKEAREAIQRVAIFLIMPSNGLGLLFFKNKPEDNILLLLAHERIWEKNDFFNSLLIFEFSYFLLFQFHNSIKFVNLDILSKISLFFKNN